jgi:hypothetical protein
MRYTEVKFLKASEFKRLTGVAPATFATMVSELTRLKEEHRKHPTRGRPPKILIEDSLLMLLMYYREYRTFFHISKQYGISEMQCWRIVTQTEQLLLQSPILHLPGKKSLHKTENNFEVIVVDVSEHPIERPKKNSEKITPVKRNDILKKAK